MVNQHLKKRQNNTTINTLNQNKMTDLKVKICDYEQKQHHFLAALNLVGIPVDYITADLIYTTTLKFQEKGGKMDLHDAVEIQHSHNKKWDNYFKTIIDEGENS
jgi:hypothetical protein